MRKLRTQAHGGRILHVGKSLLVETQQDGLNFRHRITSGDTLIASFATRWEKVPERRA